MDVRAIVLVGGRVAIDGLAAENMAGVPLALVDVLGRPVVDHSVDRLIEQGIDEVVVLQENCPGAAPFLSPRSRPKVAWHTAEPQAFWRAAASTFSTLAQAGAELVLVFRVGAYAELSLEKLIQFHLDGRSRVTSISANEGPALGFVISASRRNDAAFLFRHRLEKCRVPGADYRASGYVNLLRDGKDLRRLAQDAFARKNRLKPAGTEVRPGIWMGDGAHVHKGARILAPAYVGARAKVRAAAVITRGTTLEHHAEVDCGTVVEDATVLPFTRVGAGLDVAHAVVGFRRLLHIARDVEVEISDSKLVGMSSPYAPLRTLAKAASLAGYLPQQILRGLFASSQREKPASLPDAVQAPSHALTSPAAVEASETGTDPSKFPANLAVARRYGDH